MSTVVEELIIQLGYTTDPAPLKKASKEAKGEAEKTAGAYKKAADDVEKAQEEMSDAVGKEAKASAKVATQAAEGQAEAAKKIAQEATTVAETSLKKAESAVKASSTASTAAAKKTKGSWAKAGKFAGKALLGIGAASAAGLGLLIHNTIESAREFDTWSAKVGAGAEELQSFAIATEGFNIESDKAMEGVKTFRENLGEMARIGSGPAVDALGSLGINLKDIVDLPVEDQMAMLSDALVGVEDPAKQLSIAIEVMGEDGAALLPILKEGGAEIHKLGDEARASGRVMSEDMVGAAVEVDKKMKTLKGSLSSAGTQIVSGMLPAVADLADGTNEWVKENDEFIKQDLPELIAGAVDVAKELGGAFVTVAKAIADAKRALDDFVSAMPESDKNAMRAAGFSEEEIKTANSRVGRGMPKFLGATKKEEEEKAQKAVAQEAAAAKTRSNVVTKGAAFDRNERSSKGGGKSSAEKKAEKEMQDALFQVSVTGLGDILRKRGEQSGASSIAIDKALEAAAKSFAEGASENVALQAGQGQIEKLTGVKFKEKDPLMSMLFGTEQMPDVPMSKLEQGQQPQVLVSTINNTYDVVVNNQIDGAQEPVQVAKDVAAQFRQVLSDELTSVSKFSKVNFAR